MTENFQNSMKRNDLADILEAVIYWIKNNRQTFLSILGVTVGVILFAAFFFSRYYLIASRVSDKLSVAESYIYAGQKEQGINQLEDILIRYPKSVSAYKARLHKADFLITQGKFEEAVALAREVANNGEPELIRPLAYTHLGMYQENMQDLQGAIKTYDEFLEKYPMHFLTPKVLESLGRVHEVVGNKEKAKEIYERISTAYRGSKWEQKAAERLFVMSNPQYGGKK